jgi:predicted AAA+ superfamily ATPase
MGHQKVGASFEGFIIEQVLALLGTRDAFFWGTHQGAELDLLVMHRGKRLGFEIKLSESPSMTKSMRVALEDLKLDRLSVVYPGAVSFPMEPKVEAVAITDLPTMLAGLG